MGRVRRLQSAVLILCLLALTSCGGRYWTYRLTHDAWRSGYWCGASIQVPACSGRGSEVVVAVLGAVYLLPVILDTVLLPITVPHDLWCY